MSNPLEAYFPEAILNGGVPVSQPLSRTQRKRAQREARKAAQRPHPLAPSPARGEGEDRVPRGATNTAPDSSSSEGEEHRSAGAHPGGHGNSNALKHGLFSRDLVQTAEPLGEDTAEFESLRADMHARYRPDGEEETLLVDSIAAAWWRRYRLTRYMSRELTENARRGRLLLVCIEESERLAPHEGRLERSLSRLRRDLALLQQYRLGRKPEWKPVEAGAASPSAPGAVAPSEAARDRESGDEPATIGDLSVSCSEQAEKDRRGALSTCARRQQHSGEDEAQFVAGAEPEGVPLHPEKDRRASDEGEVPLPGGGGDVPESPTGADL
jgi:hypothetical protein